MTTNHEYQHNREKSIPYSSQSSGEPSTSVVRQLSDGEFDYTCFDKTLDYISITKIDTDPFMDGKTIKYVKDLKVAEGIVKTIISKTGRKRKSSYSSSSPKIKSARLDKQIETDAGDSGQETSISSTEFQNEATSTTELESNQKSTVCSDENLENSAQTYPDVSSNKATQTSPYKDTQMYPERLFLKRQIMRMLEKKGIDFKLHLYLVENMKDSNFSKVFSEMVEEESKVRFHREKEVTKSYLIFFIRNLEEKNERPITPEIYALTTGFAGRLVTSFADKNFVKKIERRVLEFPYRKVTYQNVSGPVSREEKSARPGHKILLSTWDYLEVLVKNRTRQIRENSSLYSLSYNTFLTKSNKHISSKFQLSESKLKIQRKLSLSQLGVLLQHFSKIFSNEMTYETSGNDGERSNEIDDERFKTFDFFSIVIDERLVGDLKNALLKVLEDSMKGKKSNIFLEYKHFEKWLKAEKFRLQVPREPSIIKSTSGKPIKKGYKRINEWNDFPSLDEVMTSLKKEYATEICNSEWLDKVMINFNTRQIPLKKCIFSRFNIEGSIGTYLYNHGNWLEVKAQYLYLIEKDFVEMLSPHLLNPDEMPFLLPWKHVGEEKSFQLQPFDFSDMKPKWEKHFQRFCKENTFDNVSLTVKDISDKEPEIVCDFQKLKGMSSVKQLAYLYSFLECNLNEDSYNSAHTLLNMILPATCDTKLITCDKKFVNELELCDIMIFNKKTTYLVHVKATFGQPMRDLCSQVRNAAEHILRELTLSREAGIIKKYWNVLTKAAKNPKTHENEVKEILENMTEVEFRKLFTTKDRDIVFVLACRDTRKDDDFSKDIHLSSDVVIKDILDKTFPEKSSEIVASLKNAEFLTEEGSLTNKFILEGKNNKGKFAKQFKQWGSIKKKEIAKTVHEVLMSGLTQSNSTIAKMEIMKLLQDFKRFYVGEKQLQLKVLSIAKDFSA